MLNFWQNIPLHINSIIFTLGNFSLRWYSLGYILAIITIYLLLRHKLKNDHLSNNKTLPTTSQLENIILFSFLGALLGGKIGYAIFYNWSNFIAHPLQIFWPFNSQGVFTGIYGMSFHGGLIGALLTGWLICKKHNLNFRGIVNFIIPAFPLGYFWGRIGNFMNGELYGRVTEKNIGMHFSDSDAKLNILRHPSQLYEALGEGILLFFILSYFTRKKFWNQNLLWLFLIFYGIIRFIIEFFRQPDAHIGFIALNWLTMGQLLSLGMIGIGVLVLFYKRITNSSNLKNTI